MVSRSESLYGFVAFRFDILPLSFLSMNELRLRTCRAFQSRYSFNLPLIKYEMKLMWIINCSSFFLNFYSSNYFRVGGYFQINIFLPHIRRDKLLFIAKIQTNKRCKKILIEFIKTCLCDKNRQFFL